jgi:hypothetical protein
MRPIGPIRRSKSLLGGFLLPFLAMAVAPEWCVGEWEITSVRVPR